MSLAPNFPPIEQADYYGVVLVGGLLTPEWLLEGYRRGVFPWPDMEVPWLLPWCSPDPRGVLEFDDLHVSRRLDDTIRSGRFSITLDRCFADVMRGCMGSRKGQTGTWITPAMLEAYTRLAELGHAHSLEVWREGELVGGIYGVSIGGFFSGESMFHRVRDASKVGLVALTRHLKARGYTLFDIQQVTPHTASMGATELPREEFLERLAAAVTLPVTFRDEPTVGAA
jgi:leucyl/phenylalanyl-tRNA--protein transferase